MNYDIYKKDDGLWWWKITSEFGDTIARSSRGYFKKFECEVSISISVKALNFGLLRPLSLRRHPDNLQHEGGQSRENFLTYR